MNHRLKLILIASVFFVPVTISYAVFYLWPPSQSMNYGELVTPIINLAETNLIPLSDSDAPPDATKRGLRGRWLLLSTTTGACDEVCSKKLYVMRQTRTILGREQARVVRVMLVEDGMQPNADTHKEYAGTLWINAQDAPWLAALKQSQGQHTQGHIYGVDPLGNIFIRYPADADIKKVVKDFNRVLKASSIG